MIIDETELNRASQKATLLPDYTSVISVEPPQYTAHPRPRNPLIYKFSEWASDHIVLMPPIEHRQTQTRPLYHITTSLKINPLAPISYVTKVSRGDTEGLVGSFDLSLYHKRATVTVDAGPPKRLASVLFSVEGSKKHWTWRYNDVSIRWDCRTPLDDGSPMCICYDTTSLLQLASFVPAPTDPDPPTPETVLTVWPDGHRYLDHILLSILVVERKRMLAF